MKAQRTSQHSIRRTLAIATLAVGVASTGAVVRAANTSNFTQSVTAGTLVTDIRDASRVSVASPSVAFSSVAFNFSCLTGGSASTGTFGTNTQRIYVDNPDAADNGWTLALAPTGGATSTWSDGASNTYDFNDPTASGCTDSADADTKAGQMTVDPSVSTLTTDCASCTTTGVTKGSSTSYNQGTTDSVTLLNAGASSDDAGRWYQTGIAGTQTIPAEQPVANYSLNMTLTATAS